MPQQLRLPLHEPGRPSAPSLPLPGATVNDVHQQFALFFGSEVLQPYAYLLSQKLSEGHVCLHLDSLEPPEDYPYKNADLKQWDRLLSEPLVSNGSERQPFVLHGNRLYLHRYFAYETAVLRRLGTFLDNGAKSFAGRAGGLEPHRALITALCAGPSAGNGSPQAPDWQLAAVLSGLLNDFTIITGGPGTGKTTTVARILALLFHLNPHLKVALAAPTGKAAARMAESLKGARLPVEEAVQRKLAALEPSTLHRLLKSIPDSPRFRHNRDNPLPFDVVIVDECSMTDLALFAKLLDAIGPSTRLMLLGDKDQLASVEAGSLFGDLCGAAGALNAFPEERTGLFNSFIPDTVRHIPSAGGSGEGGHPLCRHIVELRYSHRFSADAGIGRFSKALVQASEDVLREFLAPGGVEEEVQIEAGYAPESFEAFVSGYEAFIREKDPLQALRKFNALRVLCAVREGEQGLYAINQKIERHLQKKGLIHLSGEFYEHRPVMATRNYYHLGLFNGDTGILRNDAKGVLRAWFEDGAGGVRSVPPGALPACETVFAMTIHKSQGSEFDRVLVVLPQEGGASLLTRELLYTAVTRARKSVCLHATGPGILQCAGRRVERGSGISSRIKEIVCSL